MCLRYTINVTVPDPMTGIDKNETVVFSEKCGATALCNTTAQASDGTDTYIRCPKDNIGGIKLTLAIIITFISTLYLIF